MKHSPMLRAIALIVCLLATTRCRHTDAEHRTTPSDVVRDALTCATHGDFESMAKYYDGIDTSSADEVQNAALLLGLMVTLDGGITDFCITDEQISPDQQSAIVATTITHADGNQSPDTALLLKTERGWVLSAN